MKDKILLCCLVYLVVFLFSYNYYQSDIDKYQDALAGKIYLFNPSQEELGRFDRKSKEHAEELERVKNNINDPAQVHYKDINTWLYEAMKNSYDDFLSQKPKGANPSPKYIHILLDDAKDKRSSLMINSFAATTVVLIGAYFYWSKRKGRNDS